MESIRNETMGIERKPRSARRRAPVWAALCIGIYLLELLVFPSWTAIFGASSATVSENNKRRISLPIEDLRASL
ncbi:hypothetical protein ACFQAT_20620 [Undibacterium arcticum]|uniref:Uncharacterized protein n=1 Tax=Undibacterium arcticum TaxID=1762892 RepID=A0ABV7EYR4_9BURK